MRSCGDDVALAVVVDGGGDAVMVGGDVLVDGVLTTYAPLAKEGVLHLDCIGVDDAVDDRLLPYPIPPHIPPIVPFPDTF